MIPLWRAGVGVGVADAGPARPELGPGRAAKDRAGHLLGADRRRRLPGCAAVRQDRVRPQRVRTFVVVRQLPVRLRAPRARGRDPADRRGPDAVAPPGRLRAERRRRRSCWPGRSPSSSCCAGNGRSWRTRRRRCSSIAPFGLDTVGGQRRPDLFGYFLLAVVGIWAASRRANPIVIGLVGGLLLGVSTLLSEASPLIVGPWLVLVVAASARARGRSDTEQRVRDGLCAWRRRSSRCSCSRWPGAGAIETVAALVRAAPAEIEGHGSVFPYLSDTFRSSFERVIHGPGNKPFSILVGFVLAARARVLRPQLPSVCPCHVDVDPAHPVPARRVDEHHRRRCGGALRARVRLAALDQLHRLRRVARRRMRSCCSTAGRC